MKKLLSLLIAVLVTAGGMSGVNAYSYVDEITVKLNGSKIYFDQPPIMQNYRTLVPMRKIFETMGCLVFWDEDKQSVEAWRGGEYVMTLWVNEYSMKLGNGNYISLDVPPIVVNDRTLVPVRAISESLGADVDWDDYSQTVIITYHSPNNSLSDNNEYYNNDENSSDYSYTPDTSSSCSHTNTRKIANADTIRHKDIGSPDVHDYYVRVRTECTDCGETIDYDIEEKMVSHYFENGVCTACGYKIAGGSNSNSTDNFDDRKDDNSFAPILSAEIGSGDLNIDDDGNYKTLHLKSGESFVATNRTESSIKINVQKGDYVKSFSYVIYKPDGNVAGVRYGAAISSYGTREVNPGYTIGIYNPNEYSIDIKASSDVFFPEDKQAFEKIEIPLNQGIEIENEGQTSFDVHIYGNQYDTKSFDYVTYKSDGNVEGVRYGVAISSYGTREIKPGYILGIYNYSGNNKDTLTIMKPKEQGQQTKSGIFKIIELDPGESDRIYNDTKASFDIQIRSTAGAKKFDYTNYDSAGNADPTQFNRNISSYKTRTVKPDCSISISNSSDMPIQVYVPQRVTN